MARDGEAGRATRALAGCALAGVSLIAAVVSYLHALAVVRAVGATRPVAWLIPFLADLVILGASAALLDAARRAGRLSPLAVFSLLAGIGVTLAMNVAAGWHHGTAGALVAGWPAVAFILALESLAGMVRRGRGGKTPQTAVPASGQPVPLSLDDAIRGAAAHLSKRQIAAAFECSRSRVDKVLPPKGAVPAAGHPVAPPAAATPPGPPKDAPVPGSPPAATGIPARAPGDAAGARQAAAAARLPAPAARASNGGRRA